MNTHPTTARRHRSFVNVGVAIAAFVAAAVAASPASANHDKDSDRQPGVTTQFESIEVPCSATPTRSWKTPRSMAPFRPVYGSVSPSK